MASVAAQKIFQRTPLCTGSLTSLPSHGQIHCPVGRRKTWLPLSSGDLRISSANSGVRRRERKIFVVAASTDDQAALVEEGA